MKSITTRCIILGHRNIRESDKLIYLYSDDLGKFKALAKGARKINSKFTGHLETLNLCTASFYFGPRNIILTEITSENNYRNYLNTLEKISCAFQIAEITDSMLFEEQALENLLTLLTKTIEHLTKTKKPLLISISYIIKFLDKVGLLPDFKQLKTTTEEKYLKFFNFLKSKTLTEIENISLDPKEEKRIKDIVKKIVEREIERTFASFLI